MRLKDCRAGNQSDARQQNHYGTPSKLSADSVDNMIRMSLAASKRDTRTSAFAIFSIVAGAIGWFASFELLTEFIKTLKNPEYVPNCSVSILVTCGPNMESWQGSLFGFSNTILGVTMFTAPIAVGLALLAGARFAPWFWWLYQAGLLFGFGFILWLSYQSIFALHTLCPWCMVVWSVMIPLWWISGFRPQAVGMVSLPETVQKWYAAAYSWSWVLIVFTFLLIAVVAQVQLDWLGEFRRM